ncbi:hypothetical protein WDU94_002781 [Cyamophila willieti]
MIGSKPCPHSNSSQPVLPATNLARPPPPPHQKFFCFNQEPSCSRLILPHQDVPSRAILFSTHPTASRCAYKSHLVLDSSYRIKMCHQEPSCSRLILPHLTLLSSSAKSHLVLDSSYRIKMCHQEPSCSRLILPHQDVLIRAILFSTLSTSSRHANGIPSCCNLVLPSPIVIISRQQLHLFAVVSLSRLTILNSVWQLSPTYKKPMAILISILNQTVWPFSTESLSYTIRELSRFSQHQETVIAALWEGKRDTESLSYTIRELSRFSQHQETVIARPLGSQHQETVIAALWEGKRDTESLSYTIRELSRFSQHQETVIVALWEVGKVTRNRSVLWGEKDAVFSRHPLRLGEINVRVG